MSHGIGVRIALSTAILVASMTLGVSDGIKATAMPIALDLTGGGVPTVNPDPFTVGWAFDVNTAITVRQLGFWDEGSDGLAVSHLVRLWNGTGTMVLASATVTNASTPVAGGIPLGRWLFEDVVPVTLTPGRYVIGADGGFGSDAARLQQVISTIAEVTFVEPREISPPGFPTVVFPGTTPGIFGPTFAIPEPSSLMIAGLGMVGVMAFRTRRQRHD